MDNTPRNILVCVTQQKTCERLIRRAATMSKDRRDNLFVIHVAKSNFSFLDNNKEGEALEYLFGISKSVGANLSVLKSDDVAKSIAQFVEENGINCIIMGESLKGRQENKLYAQLKKMLKNVEIQVIPQD